MCFSELTLDIILHLLEHYARKEVSYVVTCLQINRTHQKEGGKHQPGFLGFLNYYGRITDGNGTGLVVYIPKILGILKSVRIIVLNIAAGCLQLCNTQSLHRIVDKV